MRYSAEIAYSKLVDWCNQGERCAFDIRNKLLRWGADADFIETCVEKLKKSKLLDDARFAGAFASDKSNLQRWGVRKIELHLKARSISSEHIEQAISQIEAETNMENLRELAVRKWPSIRGKNNFERTSKLIQFLMRKGFTYDSIRKSLQQIGLETSDINHP